MLNLNSLNPQQRQAVEALAHVGVAGRQPDPYLQDCAKNYVPVDKYFYFRQKSNVPPKPDLNSKTGFVRASV